MNGSDFGAQFGGRGGQGWPVSGLVDAVEHLRGAFEQRVSPRMGRGDVRAAILALLHEKPMHGYQIIQEIDERTGGAWKPSPGSVYPTLQLLSDEGLIAVEEAGGRKTYALTEEGRAVAESEGSAPWMTKPHDASHDGERTDAGAFAMPGMPSFDRTRMSALPKAGVELAQAAAQVGRSGSSEQVEEAIAVLDDARRKLYAILAQA